MVPRGASGGVRGAVWTGRHIGADLGELGCDDLEKKKKSTHIIQHIWFKSAVKYKTKVVCEKCPIE